MHSHVIPAMISKFRCTKTKKIKLFEQEKPLREFINSKDLGETILLS